jgi:pyruvate/2-oxoglutarate dehydrogenase complex dihydrolipoamide acyltransferase (E2) component
MLHRFALPDLGEGIAEGEVIAWLVEPGQTVAADEPLVEVSTDKVDVVIPSPVAGEIRELCVEAGQLVAVGTVLLEIAAEAASSAGAAGGPEAGDPPAAGAPGGREAGGPPAAGEAGGEPGVTPVVRELATRLGVDLASIRASGGGPASAHDVRAAARAPGSGGRATIARRLTEAAAIPVVTNVDAADFEAVVAAGETPLVAVASAVVRALAEHPQMNAWAVSGGGAREHERVHLGVATQTPRGLVVPVVRDADRLSVAELGHALRATTAKAREGRAAPGELRGSTFTITSAGRLAGLFATPLLNLPEVAILGLYRIESRPVVRDGQVVARRVANLSITFDHRALDGLAAAAFLARVIELIESWSRPEADPAVRG